MNSKNIISKESNVVYLIGLFCAAGLFIFTRLYKLDSIFDMWNNDEAALILNVKSLARYGTDRYGNSYPMYPLNHYGEQSPMFTYLYLIIYKLFGYSRYSIRLLTASFSIIGALYWARLYYLIDDDRRTKTLMMLLAISCFPSVVMLMRIGLDCNMMLALTPVFFFYLIKAVKTKNKKNYVVAGIAAGIILYTYIFSHLIMPLFLLILFIYLLRIRKSTISDVVALMIPVILLALPLIPFHIVNTFKLDPLCIGHLSYVHTMGDRISEINLSGIPSQLFFNMIPLFIFDPPTFETISFFGTIHWISIPFFILGLVKGTKSLISSYKTQDFNVFSVVTIWFYVVYLCNSTILTRPYKINSIYFSVVYLTIEGILEFVRHFNRAKRRSVITVIATSYFICSACFLGYYFGGPYTMDYIIDSDDDFCSFDMTDALNRVEEIRSEIGNRDLYIAGLGPIHVYYQLAKDMDSKIFYLDEDGTIREDYEEHYNNDYFAYCTDPQDSEIIMVDERYRDYCSYLTELGFQSEYADHYYIYYKVI